MKNRAVVVGGGVAGLISALVAAKKGADVTIVEQAGRAGGLWYSEPTTLQGETHLLDHGLRLPLTSGLPEWDREIFHNPRVDFDWLTFDGFPHEGAIFRDTFTNQSSCFDARLLGASENAAGLLDMIAALAKRPNGDPKAYANDAEFITAQYGATYRDAIFAPVLRGFLKRELHELAAGVCRSIVPRRLIATDLAERDRLVSQQSELEGVLAHCEYAALPRGMARKFIYPKSGHISGWIDALQKHLQDLGVTFVFNAGVKHVEQLPGSCARLRLSTGETLEADLVVWSLPLVFLAMMRPDLGLKPVIPDFITLGVQHLKLDRPIPHPTQYILNYNTPPAFFRAILHGNITTSSTSIITFEQLLPIASDENADVSAVASLNALKSAGIVDSQTEILDQKRKLHRNFFPILSPQYAAFNRDLADACAAAIPCLVVVGRAVNSALFLDGIIDDAVTKVSAGLDSGSERHAHAG